jgi:hypothetical protein
LRVETEAAERGQDCVGGFENEKRGYELETVVPLKEE